MARFTHKRHDGRSDANVFLCLPVFNSSSCSTDDKERLSMSSLFETNFARQRKRVAGKGEMKTVTRHEQVSQADCCTQSVRCTQFLSGVPRRKQLGQWRSVQAIGPRKLRREPGWKSGWSGDARSMGLPGLCKSRGVIGLLRLPDGVENARPDIGQGSDRDGMALALSPLALIILFGPGFLERTLPSELVQGVAPGLDTAQSAMPTDCATSMRVGSFFPL